MVALSDASLVEANDMWHLGTLGVEPSRLGLQPSALPVELRPHMAGMTGLEPAAWTLTVSRELHLLHIPVLVGGEGLEPPTLCL